MSVDTETWLTWGFAALVVASYLLWTIDRLPRVRTVLAVASFVCLFMAAARHGYWFSAPNTKPNVPVAQGMP